MKYILNFLLIVFCNAAFGQNMVSNGNTLPLVGYWHKGTKKNVLYTKASTTIEKGVTTSETIVVNSVWQIKDSTDKHYVIHYTYRNFTFSNPKDSLNIAMAEIFKGVTVKYRTNELGKFDTILNLKDIIDLSRKGVDNIIKKLKWPDNEISRGIINRLKIFLDNVDIIENSFKEDLVLIHYFYGSEYKLNAPYSYDSYLDNSLGGEPFPAKTVFKLTAIDAPKDVAKYTATHTPNLKEYKRILLLTLSGMAIQMQIPPPEAKDFETSTCLHKCDAEISIKEGWPKKVTFSKITKIQETKNTEVITITLTN